MLAILYKGLEHPQILVTVRVLEPLLHVLLQKMLLEVLWNAKMKKKSILELLETTK